MPVLDAAEAEAAVWAAAGALLRSAGLETWVAAEGARILDEESRAPAKRRRSLQSERERVATAAATLAGLLAEGSITSEQYARQNERYQRRLAAIAGQAAECDHARTRPDLKALAALAAATLADLAPTEQRQVLLALEARIQVQPQRVDLCLLGHRMNLRGRRVGETWHFGDSYQRLDCQAGLLTDKQVAFVRRTYSWAPKQAIAARLGRSYATLVTVARRLRQQGQLGG